MAAMECAPGSSRLAERSGPVTATEVVNGLVTLCLIGLLRTALQVATYPLMTVRHGLPPKELWLGAASAGSQGPAGGSLAGAYAHRCVGFCMSAGKHAAGHAGPRQQPAG